MASLFPYLMLVAVALGLFLPAPSTFWAGYLPHLLAISMFATSIRLPLSAVLSQKPGKVVLSLALCFIVAPLLALPMALLSPQLFAGTVIMFSAPAAIVLGAVADLLGGSAPLALSITTATTLAAVVLWPIAVFLLTGTSADINAISMMTTVLLVLVLPYALAIVFTTLLPKQAAPLKAKAPLFAQALLFLLIWGIVAAAAGQITADLPQFALLVVAMGILSLVGFLVGYFISRRYGKKEATTLGISMFYKNGMLALLVAFATFGAAATPPIVARLIIENVVLAVIAKSEKFLP